jgi:hypothetical protein
MQTFVPLLVVLLIFCSNTLVPAKADDATYFSGQDATLERAKQAQQRALTHNKLLMLVLGADWCHDSIALAQQFQQPRLAEQLNHQFVVQLMDVGYLTAGFDITQHYGLPVYWGTPTVMIIDPSTGQLLNENDLVHWSDAASHSSDEYHEYFNRTGFVLTDATPAVFSVHQEQIDAFVSTQTARIKLGYAVVGPLLEAYKRSGDKPSQTFIEQWDALRELRIGVAKGLSELKADAEQRYLVNDQRPLTLPSFAPRVWEQGEY